MSWLAAFCHVIFKNQESPTPSFEVGSYTVHSVFIQCIIDTQCIIYR